MVTKSRKVLALSLIMTFGISAPFFAALFSSEPIRLATGSLIDNQKPVIIIGETAVVASDIIIIVPMVAAIFSGSFALSQAILKKA